MLYINKHILNKILIKWGLNNMNMNEITDECMMTLGEHRDMGEILRDIRNSLVVISVELDKKYDKTERHGLKLEMAIKLIDEVRSQLEDRLFNEHPDIKTEEGCRYYY
jgi:hypothetical protein